MTNTINDKLNEKLDKKGEYASLFTTAPRNDITTALSDYIKLECDNGKSKDYCTGKGYFTGKDSFDGTSLEKNVLGYSAKSDVTRTTPWTAEPHLFRFIDGTLSGRVYTARRGDVSMRVEDIPTDDGVHRLEVAVQTNGETYKYSASRVSEQATALFGVDEHCSVQRDPRRPGFGAEEAALVETLPDRVVRQMLYGLFVPN